MVAELSAQDLSAPYEHGRWRLLSLEERDRIVLWPAHILIRHEGSHDDGQSAFRVIGWTPDGPPPKRTRLQALERAVKLARELLHDPSRFEALAAQTSEDVSTRDRGGRLGGTRASQLGPEFLDALRAMDWGSTSRVIETDDGFHILKKLKPPKKELVSGQRIVIRYQGVFGDDLQGKSKRTRDEALALAQDIAASKRPFSELVAEHSEVDDHARDGDVGVWSTIAPEHNGSMIEALAALEVGAVSAPIDTALGLQVLKRASVTELEPAAEKRVSLTYEIPNPTTFDIDGYVTHSDGAALASTVRSLRGAAAKALQLSAPEAATLSEVLVELESTFATATTASARLAARARARREITRRLSPQTAHRYLQFSQEWLASEVMNLGL